MEIAKRLNAIIAQLLPFLSQEVSADRAITPRPVQTTRYLYLHLYFCICIYNCVFVFVFAPVYLQHQQQVVTAVERAKQVTMSELNSIIGVSSQSSLLHISNISPFTLHPNTQIENLVQSFLIKRFAHLKRSKCKFAFKVFKTFQNKKDEKFGFL